MLAPDLRGFGRSEGARAFVSRWDEYRLDLLAVASSGLLDANRPLFLLCHSMGGLIGFDLVEQGGHPFGAIVATSPLLGVKVPVPAWKEALGRVASALHPRLDLATDVRPGNLTHDPVKIAEYVADPLIHQRATARWYTEMTRTLARVVGDAGRIAIPSLVVHGGADPVTDPDASRRFVERIGHADREYRSRPGEYHEVLNEVARGDLFAELAAWYRHRLVPEPAGSALP